MVSTNPGQRKEVKRTLVFHFSPPNAKEGTKRLIKTLVKIMWNLAPYIALSTRTFRMSKTTTLVTFEVCFGEWGSSHGQFNAVNSDQFSIQYCCLHGFVAFMGAVINCWMNLYPHTISMVQHCSSKIYFFQTDKLIVPLKTTHAKYLLQENLL